jgi:hypothetical protein
MHDITAPSTSQLVYSHLTLYISPLEMPIHYDLLLFGSNSLHYCILFVVEGKYFIEFMGTWVRTITSPFRKAYTIFNPAHQSITRNKRQNQVLYNLIYVGNSFFLL